MITFIALLSQVKLKSKGDVSVLMKCKIHKVDANDVDSYKSQEKEKKEYSYYSYLHLKGACGKSLALPVSTLQTGANTRLPKAGSLLLWHGLSSQRCLARAGEYS